MTGVWPPSGSFMASPLTSIRRYSLLGPDLHRLDRTSLRLAQPRRNAIPKMQSESARLPKTCRNGRPDAGGSSRDRQNEKSPDLKDRG